MCAVWFLFLRWFVMFNWMNLTCWSAPGSTDPRHHPEKEKSCISSRRVDKMMSFRPFWCRCLWNVTCQVWWLSADTLLLVQFELLTHQTTPVSAHDQLDNPAARLSGNIFIKYWHETTLVFEIFQTSWNTLTSVPPHTDYFSVISQRLIILAERISFAHCYLLLAEEMSSQGFGFVNCGVSLVARCTH